MKREYSDVTHELIERMCRNVEDKELVVNKEKAEELILQTYDLFSLPRPKNIVWCVDVFDTKFDQSAWSAGSARSEGSIGWTALDDDFDWFIFEYEYVNNKKDNQGDEPNENDFKYLEYCELLMQAKESGLGYRVECEDTLYLVPTPIVRINEDTPPQFHSDQLPAIEWRGGSEFYFLDGVSFPEDLWKQVISKEMSLSEIMKIEISDQRTVALKYNPQAIIKENAVLVHKDDRNNELYLVENSEINTLTGFPKMYFLKMVCPTGRVFIEGVDPVFAEAHPNATECQAEACGLTKSEYMDMKLES